MDKLKSVLASRKFWALVASLAATGAALASKQVTGAQALAAAVAALSAYKVGTGIESGLAGAKS